MTRTVMSGQKPPRPDLCAWAYKVIYCASALDACQLSLYMILMGGDTSLTSTGYLAINTRAPKLAMLKAIASATLTDQQVKTLYKLIEKHDTVTEYRDHLAHWAVWEDEGPDGILVIQHPAYFLRGHRAPTDNGAVIVDEKEMKVVIKRANKLVVHYWDFEAALKEPQPQSDQQCARILSELSNLPS